MEADKERTKAINYVPNRNPPKFPLKKIREEISKPKFLHSSEHSAKAFADDLSVFSSSPEDHQSLLSTIDEKCSDLNLTLKPEKCISTVFNSSKMNHTTSFSLSNGSTRNIADAPTKLLGKFIAVSTSKTKKVATAKLHCKNGSVTLTQVGLSELQLHYQIMCKQVNQKKNCTTVSLKLQW